MAKSIRAKRKRGKRGKRTLTLHVSSATLKLYKTPMGPTIDRCKAIDSAMADPTIAASTREELKRVVDLMEHASAIATFLAQPDVKGETREKWTGRIEAALAALLRASTDREIAELVHEAARLCADDLYVRNMETGETISEREQNARRSREKDRVDAALRYIAHGAPKIARKLSRNKMLALLKALASNKGGRGMKATVRVPDALEDLLGDVGIRASESSQYRGHRS